MYSSPVTHCLWHNVNFHVYVRWAIGSTPLSIYMCIYVSFVGVCVRIRTRIPLYVYVNQYPLHAYTSTYTCSTHVPRHTPNIDWLSIKKTFHIHTSRHPFIYVEVYNVYTPINNINFMKCMKWNRWMILAGLLCYL